MASVTAVSATPTQDRALSLREGAFAARLPSRLPIRPPRRAHSFYESRPYDRQRSSRDTRQCDRSGGQTTYREVSMTEPRKLVMTISLNALEHLGINLYSNIPAVLSEVVANAWDADANKVAVTIDKAAETITIQDDGTGMDRNGVIDRFLTVGYKRRGRPRRDDRSGTQADGSQRDR